MVNVLTIQHLKRNQVDVARWDACIQSATNGSPYALHDYLDALTPQWEALIAGDYEFVMPLPVRKKWGVAYLYQPFLIPQLGVFGQMPNEDMLQSFLHSIPKQIKWIDITLNPNSIPTTGNFHLQTRKNYLLNLSPPYEKLAASYRENHRRNLARSVKAGFIIDRNIDPCRIYELAESYLGPRGHFPSEQKEHFLTLANKWIGAGKASAYGVLAGDKLLASALFLMYGNRAYYLLVGNHPDGKTLGASHALIDAFIRDHAGQNLTLDFEGSDVPSLAFFYESFGASEEYYGWLRINRLPKWISWIKANH